MKKRYKSPGRPHACHSRVFRPGWGALLALLVCASCGSDSTNPADGMADASSTPDASANDMPDAGGAPGLAGAPDAGGAPDANGACVDCASCQRDASLSDFERKLIELPSGSWYEAPDTKMRSVCVPDSVGVRGVGGCTAVVDTWSGDAYDSKRHRLVLWGGGHNDYYGNELYGFDLQSGKWSRITEPTAPDKTLPGGGIVERDVLHDGNPVSRHTYDGIEYIDHLDALFGQGGSRASGGGGTAPTWLFDVTKGTWSTTSSDGPGGYNNAAAYDAAGRQVLIRTAQALSAYDLDSNAWSNLVGFGFKPLWPRYEVSGDKTAVIDPTRRLFWSVGNNDLFVWDIAQKKIVTDDWVTVGGGDYTNEPRVKNYPDQIFKSGGGDVYNVVAPGFDYDVASDAFVGWPNKGAPRALDLKTKTWSVGNATGAPTSKTSGGTYGRFRYVPAYNVFVLVVSVDENVYFYKHRANCGL